MRIDRLVMLEQVVLGATRAIHVCYFGFSLPASSVRDSPMADARDSAKKKKAAEKKGSKSAKAPAKPAAEMKAAKK
jgi:hypothetical protein